MPIRKALHHQHVPPGKSREITEDILPFYSRFTMYRDEGTSSQAWSAHRSSQEPTSVYSPRTCNRAHLPKSLAKPSVEAMRMRDHLRPERMLEAMRGVCLREIAALHRMAKENSGWDAVAVLITTYAHQPYPPYSDTPCTICRLLTLY